MTLYHKNSNTPKVDYFQPLLRERNLLVYYSWQQETHSEGIMGIKVWTAKAQKVTATCRSGEMSLSYRDGKVKTTLTEDSIRQIVGFEINNVPHIHI